MNKSFWLCGTTIPVGGDRWIKQIIPDNGMYILKNKPECCDKELLKKSLWVPWPRKLTLDIGSELVERRIQRRLKRRILEEEINVKKREREEAMEPCSGQGRRGWGCWIQGVSDFVFRERNKERKEVVLHS